MDPADLPPPLEWETPVWNLYARCSTQWRYSFGGRAGLDYGPILALAGARGWDCDLVLDLIGVVEMEELAWEAKEHERQEPRRR